MHSNLNKRSQSALEYMMTYGWAILIIAIVAVILYLYSLGIFNPSSSVTKTSTSRSTSLSGISTTFTEGGLPSGDSWSVDYDGTIKSSTGSTITFTTSSGSYSWSASASSNTSSGCTTSYNSPSGSANAGTSVAVSFYSIGFTSCRTTFYESGLPSGYTWSVYNGQTLSNNTGSPIIFTTGSGTFTAYAFVSGLNCSANASVTAGSSYTFSDWSCTK